MIMDQRIPNLRDRELTNMKFYKMTQILKKQISSIKHKNRRDFYVA